MKTVKVAISFLLATAFGMVASDEGSAQVRRARVRAAELNNTQVVKTPGTTYADEAAHQENQQSRQQRWNQASPNQKATTFNVANSKYQKKQTNKANASAALSQRTSTRGTGR
jgi:hypothetical protein